MKAPRDIGFMKDAEQRRLAWRCRRGMLELDIVLQKFVDTQFNELSLAELSAFDVMLELPDNDFWALMSASEMATKSNNQLDDASKAVITKLKQVNT